MAIKTAGCNGLQCPGGAALKSGWRRIALLWLWLALGQQAFAAGPTTDIAAVTAPGSFRIDLRPHLALLEDPGGRLGFDQVRGRDADFISLEGRSPNFGFTASVWWVRLTLRNPGAAPRDVVLRQDYPLIDRLDLWSPDDGGHWRQVATGDRTPFDTRPLDHRVFLFPVTLAPQGDTTLYLRFQTDGAMNIGLFAHSPEDLVGLITEEYLALGVYYGGFIVLLIYNLIMFLTVRERAFAYYLLYALSYGLYMSVHNGLSFQYLWPNNTWLANQSLLILLALSLFGCLRFTREILSSATLIPRADRIAWAMELSMVVALVVAPFMSYRSLIVPMAWMTAVICAHALAMGILALIRGSGPARYYLVAFSALLAGVLAYMLKTFGVLPHNAITQNAFQIGSLVEMVLLSLAIGSRVNEIKQQGYQDALTQLHNRRYFNDQMEAEFQKARRRSQPLSLLVLDIDHFKAFNDTHGHAHGDQALKRVARILADSTRKPNMPCRYGGEEFVVILPNTGADAVRVVAERIRSRVAKETADSFRLSVSIGHATTKGEAFADPRALFEAADLALYAAKAAGRNRVCGHDPDRSRAAAKQGVALPA